MKALIAILISSYLHNFITAADGYCDTVKCLADQTIQQEQRCLIRKSNPQYNEYFYVKCEENMVCSDNKLSDREVKCIDKSKTQLPSKLYDGQFCNTNEDCHSNNCFHDICLGIAIEKECETTDQCATTLYCYTPPTPPTPPKDLNSEINDMVYRNYKEGDEDKKVCKPQLSKLSECKEEYDCRNNATCVGKGTKQCQEFFSKENGEEVEDVRLCKSMQIAIKEGKKICVNIALENDNKECPEGKTDCSYVAKINDSDETPVEKIQKKCECSYQYHNKMFCPINPSGDQYKEYLTKLKEFYSVETHDYHSKRRTTTLNPELKRFFFLIDNYPKFIDADDCAIEFFMFSTHLSLTYSTIIYLSLLFLSLL